MSDPTPNGPSATPQSTPSASRGTIALVLGIVAAVVAFIPFVGWLAVGFGVAALVLGIRGLKRPAAKTRSRVGLILGAVSIPLSVPIVVAWALLLYAAAPGAQSGPGPQNPPISATATNFDQP